MQPLAATKYLRCLLIIAGLTAGGQAAPRAAAKPPTLASQSFDTDPAWDGFRNRLAPEHPQIARQEFGYRTTNRADGREPGEIGGRVQRSSSAAYYAMKITPQSLDQPLHASGTLAVPVAEGGSGVMIGWFGAPPLSWRTPNSVALRLDGNGGKFWAFYEYGTSQWRTGGGGAFEGERYQETPTPPFPADGKPHRWSLDYDPNQAEGRGELRLRIDDREYRTALAEGHRADGARLDHFGIWNVQTPGAEMELYLDDLTIDGQQFSFDVDPAWEAEGNNAQHVERFVRPFHDYGFSQTSHAGSTAGELGGVVFRDEQPSYYAASVGGLTLDDELQASGRLALSKAASDSGVYLGWFNSKTKREKNTPDYETGQANYLGILIEGPSRAGHYFRPAYGLANGQGQIAGEVAASGDAWPLIRPDGAPHTWSIHYHPATDGGGKIEVRLDDRSDVLTLRPDDRKHGATFDRFGLLNLQAGGHAVEIYLDDLRYSRR